MPSKPQGGFGRREFELQRFGDRAVRDHAFVDVEPVAQMLIFAERAAIAFVGARIPAMNRAAWLPATPPPRITTSAGGTPGTPPSSTPRPPFSFSRQRAPTCGAMRPATSDIGVNSGSVPWGDVTVS